MATILEKAQEILSSLIEIKQSLDSFNATAEIDDPNLVTAAQRKTILERKVRIMEYEIYILALRVKTLRNDPAVDLQDDEE